MAEPIGALRGELSLSAAQFEADIKAARSALRREAAGMEQSMRSFQMRTDAALRTFGNLSVIAAGAAAGLAAFSRQAINSADQIAKTADKVGVTTDELQRLRFAAELSGVATATMDTALQRLARRTGEAAQGAGVLKGVLEQYGIAATDAEGNARSTAEVLRDLAGAMQRAGTEQERLRIAVAAFDTEGAGLVNLLRNGTAGLDQLTARADKLGIVLDSALIRRAEVASDRLTELHAVMKAKASVLALELMPALEGVAEAMTSPKLLEGANELAEGFARLVQFTVAYNREITALVTGGLAARLPLPPWLKLVAGAGTALGVYQALQPETERLTELLAKQETEVERLDQAWRRAADPAIARGIHEQMMAAVEAAAETRRQLAGLEAPALAAEPPTMPPIVLPPIELPSINTSTDRGLAERLQREEDQRKAAIDREIEAIRQSLMTREELENAAQEQRLESLRAGLEMGILAEQEFGELRLATELATLERLNEMRDQQLKDERRQVEERVRLEQQWADQVIAAQFRVGQHFASLMATIGQKSKAAAVAAVALNAALMAGQAWQSTLAAEMRALAELGPIAGPPMAAKIRAWGLANVAGILATNLAQGFAGAGGGGAAGGGGGAAASAAAVAQPAASRAGIAYVSLDSRRTRFSADEVEDMAEQINDLIGDGFDLREIRVRR